MIIILHAIGQGIFDSLFFVSFFFFFFGTLKKWRQSHWDIVETGTETGTEFCCVFFVNVSLANAVVDQQKKEKVIALMDGGFSIGTRSPISLPLPRFRFGTTTTRATTTATTTTTTTTTNKLGNASFQRNEQNGDRVGGLLEQKMEHVRYKLWNSGLKASRVEEFLFSKQKQKTIEKIALSFRFIRRLLSAPF